MSDKTTTTEEILESQVIHIKRGRMNKFGFEPAWNSYYDFYLSDKYLEKPVLKLEDIAFHLFLRKNLNDNDPSWRMPSFRMMKRRLGVGQNRIDKMLDRLTKAYLLKKVSGKRKGKKSADVANTYVLSDPIQELEDFLAVANADEFPQPLREEWKDSGGTPVPVLGTGGRTQNGYGAVPKTGTRKHTSSKHTSTTVAEGDGDINNNSSGNPQPKADVVVLTDLGISKKIASRLADRYKKERILERVEWFNFLIENSPDKIKDPPAYLRRSIEERDWEPPTGYKSKAKREAEATEKERKRQKQGKREAEEEARWKEELERRQNDRTPYDDIWDKALEQVQQQTDKLVFITRYSLTRLLSITDDGVATIQVPNQETLQWLSAHQLQGLDRFIKPSLESLGHPVTTIRFDLADTTNSDNMQAAQNQNPTQPP